ENGKQYKIDVHVHVTVTDNNQVTEKVIKLDGQQVSDDFTVSAEAPDPHKIEILARDAAGNTANFDPIVFVIDKTQPKMVRPAMLACRNADVVSGPPKATDAHMSKATQTLDGAAFDSGGTLTTDKAYQLIIKADDVAGNSSTEVVNLILDKTLP